MLTDTGSTHVDNKHINKHINTDGDRQLPCLTPLPTISVYQSALLHLTATFSLEYQLTSKSMIHRGIPIFIKAEQILK